MDLHEWVREGGAWPGSYPGGSVAHRAIKLQTDIYTFGHRRQKATVYQVFPEHYPNAILPEDWVRNDRDYFVHEYSL